MLPSSSSGISARRYPLPRPASALNDRPTSSQSLHSLLRPSSSASIRPTSRLSQRPNSRQARQARLLPLCEKLVRQILSLPDDVSYISEEEKDQQEEWIRRMTDYSVKNLESTTLNKGAVVVDLEGAEKMIRSHARKARVRSQDVLGEAIEAAYKELKRRTSGTQDIDQEIQASQIPAHLQLLLALSDPATPSTVTQASLYLEKLRNPDPGPTTLTWADILGDEPFEGEHWDGAYGLPHGFVRRAQGSDETSDEDTSPSISGHEIDGDSDDYENNTTTSSSSVSPDIGLETNLNLKDTTLPVKSRYAHRKEVEDLREKQYWRDDWKMPEPLSSRFRIDDASTLGPSLQRALGHPSIPSELLSQGRYIYEHDAVRELLIAMQGRENIMLKWDKKTFSYKSYEKTPQLRHLSLASQASILTSFAKTCTTVRRLRHFAQFVLMESSQGQQVLAPSEPAVAKKKVAITVEAFADAVSVQVCALDAWCADQETLILRARCGSTSDQENNIYVASLLQLERSLRTAFGDTYEAILAVTSSLFDPLSLGHGVDGSEPHSEWTLPSYSPSSTTTLLLDRLFNSIQERMDQGQQMVASNLKRIFVQTAEPVWDMLGQWLRIGMDPISAHPSTSHTGSKSQQDELERDFFVESHEITEIGFGLLDPDFWRQGYTLRTQEDNADADDSLRDVVNVPAFMSHVAELALAAGKAVGLLKILGFSPSVTNSSPASLRWRPFSALLVNEDPTQEVGSVTLGKTSLFSVSVETLSRLIYDELAPSCREAGAMLVERIFKDCALFRHLDAVVDLYFMRRGDVMSHFSDLLFAKMDATTEWTDFHFLNSAFADAVEAATENSSKSWIDPAMVRFSYAGTRDQKNARVVDGLRLDYASPFPLTYIFNPTSMQIYGGVFVLLLQLKRAKSALQRLATQKSHRNKLEEHEKVFYSVWSRLIWFVNTILHFITTDVLHTSVTKFSARLSEAASLDEVIQQHEAHLHYIRDTCLWHEKHLPLYSGLMAILDICIAFDGTRGTPEGNTAYAEGSMRVRTTPKRRHRYRSRRIRRERRNVVSFSGETIDSSDGDTDEEEELSRYDAPTEQSITTEDAIPSGDSGSLFSRLNKTSANLDNLVRYMRKYLDGIASDAGPAERTLGILNFALEDWDL